MTQLGLTAEQARCLDIIAETINQTGSPPTYQEIAEKLGVSSKSRAFELVKALEERGHIRRGAGKARTIALVDPNDADMVDAITDLEERALSRRLLRTAAALREARQIAQAEEGAAQ